MACTSPSWAQSWSQANHSGARGPTPIAVLLVFVDRVALHPPQHLVRLLAAHALVEHRDRVARQQPAQLALELGRIGGVRRGRAHALGRRRADRDDADRRAGRHEARQLAATQIVLMALFALLWMLVADARNDSLASQEEFQVGAVELWWLC